MVARFLFQTLSFVNSHKTTNHIFLKNIGFWGFQGAIFVV